MFLFRVLFVCFLGLLAFVTYENIAADDRVPIARWDRVEVLNSPVAPGEPLRTRIYREKVRDDCPVASSRQVISEDGRVYDIADAVSPGGPADKAYVPWDYPLPGNLPPGSYTLRVTLTYECPEFTWVTDQPDARFRVLKPGDK